MRYIVLILTILTLNYGCKKNIKDGGKGVLVNDSSGIFGEWKWTSSNSGLYTSVAVPDSIITLALNPADTYAIEVNGQVVKKGTFSITINNYLDTILHFNNFPPTDQTSNSIRFGTYSVGRQTFFVDNVVNTYNDTLQFLSFPISPEAYNSVFAKR